MDKYLLLLVTQKKTLIQMPLSLKENSEGLVGINLSHVSILGRRKGRLINILFSGVSRDALEQRFSGTREWVLNLKSRLDYDISKSAHIEFQYTPVFYQFKGNEWFWNAPELEELATI